jgi:hypothetical protein
VVVGAREKSQPQGWDFSFYMTLLNKTMYYHSFFVLVNIYIETKELWQKLMTYIAL